MKNFVLVLILFSTLMPISVFAAFCSANGYTVVYVNGILTSEVDARKDKNTLETNFIYISGRTDVKFLNGYNQSHIAGFGDLIESASQLRGSPISDYDLKTILLQLYPQVTTRKILLLGHSQGTFYTNEIYDYLLGHGEQKESIAVYNVATPASSVAGYADVPAQGAYLTSENDRVISAVRIAAQKLGAKQPLPTNIAIPLSSEDVADQFGGHSFSGVYLAAASARIVSEIGSALQKLVATEISNTADAGCFAPPTKNFSYRAQEKIFAVADQATVGFVAVNSAVNKETDKAVAAVVRTAKQTAEKLVVATKQTAAVIEQAGSATAELIRNSPIFSPVVAPSKSSLQASVSAVNNSVAENGNGTGTSNPSAAGTGQMVGEIKQTSEENKTNISNQAPAEGESTNQPQAEEKTEPARQESEHQPSIAEVENEIQAASKKVSDLSEQAKLLSQKAPAEKEQTETADSKSESGKSETHSKENESHQQIAINYGSGGGGGGGGGSSGGGSLSIGGGSVVQAPHAAEQISLSITEIMYNTSGTDDGREWVEIFNSGTSIADVTKLKFFENGTNHGLHAAQEPKGLTPNSYAVLVEDSSKFLSDYPSYAGKLFDSSFSLSNDGETIAIKNGDAVVDETAYVSSTGAAGDGNSLQLINGIWLAATPTPGQANATSSSRIASGTSLATSSINGASSSSATATTATASSTSSSETSTASSSISHVLISEVLFNASGTDAGKEFVELYNPNAASANVSGWSLKYQKEGSASTTSLASFKSASHPEDNALIQPKGFLLVGLNDYDLTNYGGTPADIARLASLPNGESDGSPETITLMLFNGSSFEVDRIAYNKNSIASEGQSIERKVIQNGTCISPQQDGEFLGNGCDTDQSGDFEIRISPNPQNSGSLPEPRSAPAINNFRITYDFAPRFDFSWDASEGAAGATSTLSYRIYDMSNSSSTRSLQASSSNLIFSAASAASTTFAYPITEVGRDYHFTFAVQDRDGLSRIASSTVSAKSFLDTVSFYRDTRGAGVGYLFDLIATSSRPFWDRNDQSTTQSWKAVVFYLNEDAPKQNSISTDNALIPSDPNFIRLSYESCGGGGAIVPELIFALNSHSCQPGPLSARAYLLNRLEDMRFAVSLASSTSDISLSPIDYATLAFYDFGGGGGGSQRLQLAAVDKTKYFFQNPPAGQSAPTTPGNFSVTFASSTAILTLNWSSSTDSDTLDNVIGYQVNYSTSSSLFDSAWQTVPTPPFSTSTLPIFPNAYTIGVRAIDDFGNRSTPAVIDWRFPADFAVLPSQLKHDTVIGPAGNGEKIFIAATTTIDAAAFFVEPGGGSHASSQSYVEIHEDAGDSIGSLIATSTPHTIGQFDAPQEFVYAFPSSVPLRGNTSYWLVPVPASSSTSQTSIYGTLSDSYPDGTWSGHPGYDAYFRLIQQ